MPGPVTTLRTALTLDMPDTHPGRLASKVAIVTGGASGFGAGIVSKFTHEGAKVLILDLDASAGAAMAAAQPPNSTSFQHADISKASDWATAVEECIARFGGLDVVVNNAGVVHRNIPSLELGEEEYDRIMRINVKGLYHSVRTCCPVMQKRGGGSIVNISSISAPRPRPGLVWYAGSKGAVNSVRLPVGYSGWLIDRVADDVDHSRTGGRVCR